MVREIQRTKPRPNGAKPSTHAHLLLAHRYGTPEMGKIWGAEQTFEYSLGVQGQSAMTLSRLHPDVVPPEHAEEIHEKATLKHVSAQKVREIEEKTGHDVIAFNSALQEVLSPEAATHVNKFKTSADSTENAKALQLKQSLEVIIESVENLRDVVLERAKHDWRDVPHQDVSHWYDAVPATAGRPFVFYAEMLQSDLDFLKQVHAKSIVGKWADATGNHHSAHSAGVDGVVLQEQFCQDIGVSHMEAPAQIPGREYISDVVYAMTRTGGTIKALADYIRWGRSDDVALFKFPLKKKGSSAMPHKTAKGGNPSGEEQAGSFFSYAKGVLTTSVDTIPFAYARDLTGSSSDRITLEGIFKFGDHTIRRMAGIVDKLILDEDRSVERVDRTYGCTTSQRVMTYLTDHRRVENPMTRDEAHTLCADLATEAYMTKVDFFDLCNAHPDITSRIRPEVLSNLTDARQYTGESRRIIDRVYAKCHGKKTLE